MAVRCGGVFRGSLLLRLAALLPGRDKGHLPLLDMSARSDVRTAQPALPALDLSDNNTSGPGQNRRGGRGGLTGEEARGICRAGYFRLEGLRLHSGVTRTQLRDLLYHPTTDAPGGYSSRTAFTDPSQQQNEVRGDEVSALGKEPISSPLQTLNLSECSQLVDVSALGPLTALRGLGLAGCSQLVDVSALGSLTTLQTLDLSSCDEPKRRTPEAGTC